MSSQICEERMKKTVLILVAVVALVVVAPASASTDLGRLVAIRRHR